MFKINLIAVHRISAESTKKPVCEQRSEYAPTQDVSFMASTIDKQLFLRNLPFINTQNKFYQAIYFSRVALLSTCCSDSGLTRMQILMNLIRLSRSSLVICFKN